MQTKASTIQARSGAYRRGKGIAHLAAGAVAGAGHTLVLGLQALLETVVHTAEKQAGA
jgi:hypothetical protein